MLITLDQIEAQQCITVWHGAQWRMYDYVPPPDLRLPDYAGQIPPVPRRHRSPKGRTKSVLEVLSDVPQRANQIATKLHIKSHEATSRLMRYVRQGRVVQTYVEVGWKKAPIAHYAKAK